MCGGYGDSWGVGVNVKKTNRKEETITMHLKSLPPHRMRNNDWRMDKKKNVLLQIKNTIYFPLSCCYIFFSAD